MVASPGPAENEPNNHYRPARRRGQVFVTTGAGTQRGTFAKTPEGKQEALGRLRPSAIRLRRLRSPVVLDEGRVGGLAVNLNEEAVGIVGGQSWSTAM